MDISDRINELLSQPPQARPLRSDNTSGVRGVYRTASGRWRADIYFGGRKKTIGTFDTLEEAAQARQDALDRYGTE